jgi:D-alanine-D-alanine ligase
MSQKTILLFGGNSEERLVSVASAQNLASQYNFSQLIFQDFKQKLYEVSLSELNQHKDVFKTEFVPKSSALASDLQNGVHLFEDSLVFLGYHGSQGENGEVQKLFEKHRICFTGSGSQASKQAFEKNLAKEVMGHTSAKMAQEFHLKVENLEAAKPKLTKFLAQHKKIVLKPTSSGSSFGLHIVDSPEKLEKALTEIQKSEFSTYLVENFIKGRELTVGVTQENDELIALPASEVVLSEGHSFDYDGKYLGAGSKEITPASLTDDELQAAQKLAVEAHLAFGCYGYSRTDMILTAEGPYFLETNTLPGLSRPSFIPQQLLAADITFKSFIEAQLHLAEHRYDT